MAYIINMPKLEQGMQQGTLVEWLVDVGEAVSEEQPIAEIESEKTISEIAAREDGVLRRIFVEPGETVAPGTALGVVAGPDEEIEELLDTVDVDTDATEAETSVSDPDLQAEPTQSQTTVEQSKPSTDQTSGPDRVSPAARRRADDLGVDVTKIDGTGPEGAVISDDIERIAATHVEATANARERASELGVDLSTIEGSGPRNAVTVADVEATASDVREKRELSGMRRTIGERLGKSHREAPHVTVHREVEVEELLAAADVADRYADADVSITDLLLVAVSATLTEHPEFNATFEDGTQTLYSSQHIGVAVDIEGGLVTPVVEEVDSSSLDELATQRQALTKKVLDNEFSTAEITGGTFTVSNLGGFGVDSFTPIINPPEVAILGIDRIQEKPVRDGDNIAFRDHIGFDLSFDHRVVDGADAARFLRTLAEHLQDPWPLLLDRV